MLTVTDTPPSRSRVSCSDASRPSSAIEKDCDMLESQSWVNCRLNQLTRIFDTAKSSQKLPSHARNHNLSARNPTGWNLVKICAKSRNYEIHGPSKANIHDGLIQHAAAI